MPKSAVPKAKMSAEEQIAKDRFDVYAGREWRVVDVNAEGAKADVQTALNEGFTFEYSLGQRLALFSRYPEAEAATEAASGPGVLRRLVESDEE